MESGIGQLLYEKFDDLVVVRQHLYDELLSLLTSGWGEMEWYNDSDYYLINRDIEFINSYLNMKNVPQ